MPIPADLAEELIRRLNGMLRYPGEWTPIEEQMIQTLAESARDRQHAESLVARFLANYRYAPMPCDIREMAVADADPTRRDHTPSPYDQPGYSDGSLTDGMTIEDIARWQKLAERTKHPATRKVALDTVADFYRRHPHLTPKMNGEPQL